MKIFDRKLYMVYKPGETETLNAHKMTGPELRLCLKDGSIRDGDEIYAVRLLAVAKEERRITLQDAGK